ncbi:MAG: hypothetical protein [Caudoviricetes sp.]|nr:MAG: hypothetical protein [Caudoviricetes sp.]
MSIVISKDDLVNHNFIQVSYVDTTHSSSPIYFASRPTIRASRRFRSFFLPERSCSSSFQPSLRLVFSKRTTWFMNRISLLLIDLLAVGVDDIDELSFCQLFNPSI